MSADDTEMREGWRELDEFDAPDLAEPILEIQPTSEQPRAFEPVLLFDLDEDDDEAPAITIH